MKIIRQLCIVFGFSTLGELCHAVIPFPIPASIYGLILLSLALVWKLIPLEWVMEAGDFLVKLLPLMFVIPTVGILNYWEVLAPHAIPIGIMVALSTVITFAVSGLITQWLLRKGK